MTGHISKEQISAWLDSQLTDKSLRQIAEHFSICPDCRTVRDEMSSVDQMFREMEVLDPPAYLWSKISAGVDAADTSTGGWIRRHGFVWAKPLWLRVEAWGLAAVLVIGCGVAVMHWSNSRTVRQQLAEIDRAYRTLTPQNAESYNPFATSQIDTSRNPFRLIKPESGDVSGSSILRK